MEYNIDDITIIDKKPHIEYWFMENKFFLNADGNVDFLHSLITKELSPVLAAISFLFLPAKDSATLIKQIPIDCAVIWLHQLSRISEANIVHIIDLFLTNGIIHRRTKIFPSALLSLCIIFDYLQNHDLENKLIDSLLAHERFDIVDGIKLRLLTFTEIEQLSQQDIKLLIDKFGYDIIHPLLRLTERQVQAGIYKNEAKPASIMIKEDVKCANPVSLKDIEAQRRKIVNRIRMMVYEGLIKCHLPDRVTIREIIHQHR